MPDRLPSLVLLVGCWVAPAAAGWVAAGIAHRSTPRVRAILKYAVLTSSVLAWSAVWFFVQLNRMPPYIPGASEDPTYAPPQAVAGLAVVASALVLPVSAIACALAFRSRGRSLTRASAGLLVSGILLAGSIPPLFAQRAIESPDSGQPKPLCFRGRPLPACKAFALTEFSVSVWLSAEPPGENPPPAISEFGVMRNVGTRNAIGGSFFLDAGHKEVVGGLALRYRYWFNSNTGLDLGLGTPIVGYAALDWATLKAKLTYRDLVGPVTRLELGGETTYWNLGLEVGSGAGVIGTVAAAVFGIIAAASL